MAEHTPHIPLALNSTGSFAAEYFDRLYAADPDPWDFESSPYETAKYAATLDALPRKYYGAGLELGCSIGVLTRLLSDRCESLLAIDLSEAALDRAKLRCADLPKVRFERRDLSREFPAGSFDLIIVSEVAYYLSPADLHLFYDRLCAAAAPGCHVLLVHYLGATNYPLTADQVHEAFLMQTASRSTTLLACRTAAYRLDLLELGIRSAQG